jgi:hypothetical protein
MSGGGAWLCLPGGGGPWTDGGRCCWPAAYCTRRRRRPLAPGAQDSTSQYFHSVGNPPRATPPPHSQHNGRSISTTFLTVKKHQWSTAVEVGVPNSTAVEHTRSTQQSLALWVGDSKQSTTNHIGGLAAEKLELRIWQRTKVSSEQEQGTQESSCLRICSL